MHHTESYNKHNEWYNTHFPSELPPFLLIKMKKFLYDALVKLRAMPSQVLTTIIFKQLPDENTKNLLKKNGYDLVYIPENPYLN